MHDLTSVYRRIEQAALQQPTDSPVYRLFQTHRRDILRSMLYNGDYTFSTPILLRIGMPEICGRLPNASYFSRQMPLMISASSLWNWEKKKFHLPKYPGTMDSDVALDSAGFTAMTNPRWGKRYPWTIEQYVEMAWLFNPTWWSSMDFCCEPDVAKDRATIDYRVSETAANLGRTYAIVDNWRQDIDRENTHIGYKTDEQRSAFYKDFFTDPMPIMQGWLAEDYVRCAQLTNEVLAQHRREWPTLIGVGSVCRRHRNGEAGLLTVLAGLDSVLPRHVKLHLFGVKGDLLGELTSHPRVVSADSMAWDFAARRQAGGKGKYITPFRVEKMIEWYDKNMLDLCEAALDGGVSRSSLRKRASRA